KSAIVPTFANKTDYLALLDFKNRITQDPLQIMSSWNDSIQFCNWLGVTCSPSSKQVIVLDLEAKRLVGPMPPSLGNLTHLIGINLRNNRFYGEIPQEVGHLQHLQHLDLSVNSFGGKLPPNLSSCSQLRVLNITYNNLIGQIPHHPNSLSKLVYLSLDVNSLTGNIPAWIGNFSSLYGLGLSRNNFQGSIPSELGRLPGYGLFQLSQNYLSGTIPPLIFNISSILFFSITQNQLHGSLPIDVGLTLPNLQIFYGSSNNFIGPIPVSLSDASQLEVLDLPKNSLTGTVPKNLGSLQGLVTLYFEANSLGYGKDGDLKFLNFLSNCTGLEILGLAVNYFGGLLPSSIANLSTQLQILTLSENMIRGDIPVGIGDLVNLNVLVLEYNYLGGALPFEVGNLIDLAKLDLSNNRLSGKIPTTLQTCISLEHLYLDGNSFEGEIPQFLKNLRGLEDIDLSRNRLFGHIPEFLGKLLALKYLNISYNDFEGEVPSDRIFANASTISIFGNDKLCCGVQGLHLSTCSKSTNRFFENNLVGSGSFGSVYKGVLSRNGAIVAVKVLNLQQQGALKSFINECNALRDIRLMFIGKRPTDEVFKDGQNIHTFIAMALPEHVIDIIDQLMFFEEDEEEVDDTRNEEDVEGRAIVKEENLHVNVSSRMIDCLMSVFQIGLSCSASSPNERIRINVVVNEMIAIRGIVHKLKKGRRRASGCLMILSSCAAASSDLEDKFKEEEVEEVYDDDIMEEDPSEIEIGNQVTPVGSSCASKEAVEAAIKLFNSVRVDNIIPLGSAISLKKMEISDQHHLNLMERILPRVIMI
ncbi:probable LRR receptor-like serine/threonine-protein kinase At3g47570, partial [Quercus robur]|uniref:probable LRR receptor-like serine/threonine-protein kinase At3g47570 n=1 Tax=Quercus robur TaxID=38942 RepID=UPI002161C513